MIERGCLGHEMAGEPEATGRVSGISFSTQRPGVASGGDDCLLQSW